MYGDKKRGGEKSKRGVKRKTRQERLVVLSYFAVVFAIK